MPYPHVAMPASPKANTTMLVPPLPAAQSSVIPLDKTENIASIPELRPVPDTRVVTVVLKVGGDISTDDIVPAGKRVMPYRSNIPRLGEFVHEGVDRDYPARARASAVSNGHAIVAGNNYGQGSSRENASLAPRHLGLRVVLARSFARIHWQNLVNFGGPRTNTARHGAYSFPQRFCDNGGSIIADSLSETRSAAPPQRSSPSSELSFHNSVRLNSGAFNHNPPFLNFITDEGVERCRRVASVRQWERPRPELSKSLLHCLFAENSRDLPTKTLDDEVGRAG